MKNELKAEPIPSDKVDAMVSSLSKAERNTIESIAWAMEHFGSLATSRQDRRSTMMKLIERGLAVSVGQVEMCDDDGFMKDPTIYREGFQLTNLGLTVRIRIVEDEIRELQSC